MTLRAQKITKVFDGPVPLHVLRGVSLTARPGESIAIMGKSGEGKSTLLHILGTLEPPTEGELEICGKSIHSEPNAHLRNSHIGFIFQSYHLLEDFTVLDNVVMPLKIGRIFSKETKKRAEHYLAEVGMSGKESVLAKFLSGGEKQRVAIARALVCNPKLILADEPTGNLDNSYSQIIQKLLLDMSKQHKATLIVATHDESFAKKCDRLLFLKEGELYNQPT